MAGRQHGLITTEQLVEIGLSSGTISAWSRSGRLHRLHRGVYAVGHTDLAREGFWMAAVLAGGSRTLLSHLSAAYLWKLLEPDDGPIHITVPTSGGRARRNGLVIHRAILLPSQTTFRARIPVTRPTRTLCDLRRIAPAHVYREALRQAEYDRLPLDLPTDGTRSEQESLFLAICRRYRIPLPEVNQELGPYTVDFLWRAERLVVETDSWPAHGGRVAYSGTASGISG